ncbi:19382_t:CDS:2, partial [Dentiscutata erythropus]
VAKVARSKVESNSWTCQQGNEKKIQYFETYEKQEPTPIELDRTELKNNRRKGFLRTNKDKTLTREQKQTYKRNGQCFVCRKKGYWARDCRSKG